MIYVLVGLGLGGAVIGLIFLGLHLVQQYEMTENKIDDT